MLEIRLLGQFDVRSDGGTPLVIPSRLHQSLLAYLLVTRTTAHRRETIAGLFWSEASETDARRNLRQALWRLRKALDTCSPPASDLVVSDDLTVGIDLHATYSLDLARLEAAPACLSTHELMGALDGYRGELLPDFYDEWVTVERARLQVLFEQQVERLLEQLCGETRWKETLRWAERWIGLGQSPEPAYRALMVAHSALGNRSQVAAAFERCVAALKADLGVEPSEQTRALYERLAHGPAAPGTPLISLPHSPPPIFVVAAPAAPVTDAAPYKGLRYFDEDDADLFFGRERLVATLVGHLHEHHWLTVVGASGSGKSSLVRAGLIPALKDCSRMNRTPWPEGSGEWVIQVLTPTAHPLEALAIQLTRGAESAMATTTLIDDLARDSRTLRIHIGKSVGETRRRLFVIDQFEELFTLCRDERERQSFIANLLLATAPELDQPVYVVVALRADFYAQCAAYANLREAFSRRQEYIGPMTAEEMRRAVEGPAQHGRWELEPGLVDLILRDVGNEPGALPLLSHALLETWRQRCGRTLTFTGYAACGGVLGAIAQTAESVYQNLSPEQQTLARNIFVRLTELGEGTEDTRRRATIGELVSHAADAPAIEKVLGILADARLVMVDETTAEVAHEALIREWDTLREWLTQNREGLRIHRHLTEAAQAWCKLNRDPGELYRGVRLAQALEWAKTNVGELNPLEREFLDASKQWQERETEEREAQRNRALEAARRLAEAERKRAEEQTRATHRLRQRAVFLAGALFIAALLAASSAVFAQQSNQNATRAEDERRLAFARELSVNAVGNLDVDPERSILLALQAVSVSSEGGKPVLLEAEEALHRAAQTSRVQLTLHGHTSGLGDVAYSPDGKRLVTGSRDQTAKVWDAATGRELLTLTGHSDEVNGVAFSPDGTRVATASFDKTAKVWDAATGKELMTLSGHTDQVWDVAFSPDGRRIATSSADKTTKVWDAYAGKELLTLSGHTDLIRALVYSPDGTRIYTASYDQTAKAWDAATGKELLTFAGHTSAIWSIAVSPDGTRLATGGFEGTTKLWDTASGRQLANMVLGTADNGVAFNQTGTRLATCGGSGVATVWDVATGQSILVLRGHTASVNACAFSPDPQGTRLATSSGDSTAKVWNITPAGARDWLTFAGHSGRVHDVAYSPDGKTIASASADKTAKVWDAATGAELLTLTGHANWVLAVAFSPDAKRLATAADDLTAKVWDLSTGQVLLTLPDGPPTQGLRIRIAFSPDGKRLAITGDGNTAKVWDAISGQELLTLSGHTMLIQTVAFSPDGRRIATASQDKTAKVWDAATGKELLTLSGHSAQVRDLAFSRDGTRIVTASSDGTAKVWDAVTGKLLLTLSGHSGNVLGAAFSPDGTQIATASGDKTVKIWNVAQSGRQGEQPLTLYGATASVFTVAYSPDGKRLAAASIDGTVRVYALPLEDIVAIAKSRLTRTWTLDECQKFLHTAACPPQ